MDIFFWLKVFLYACELTFLDYGEERRLLLTILRSPLALRVTNRPLRYMLYAFCKRTILTHSTQQVFPKLH